MPRYTMRVGVITYWTSNNNYGQLLQCYALQRALEKLGHEAFLIPYDPFSSPKSIRERLSGISISKILSVINGERSKEIARQNKLVAMDVRRNFDDFRKHYLQIGAGYYSSISELRETPPSADAYICGSDQVWHNSLLDPETAAWYLDFGDARRIAYAASISRDLEAKETLPFKRYLNRFSSISLRESSATKLCQSLGFHSAQTVLDPTLLIDEPDYPIADGEFKDRYFFAYIVNVVERDACLWDAIGDFCHREGMTVKPVYSSGYRTCVDFLSDEYPSVWPTIPEWIGLLKKSCGVITTSYHGVALSIVMHKPFISIPLGSPADARTSTLLESLGLNDRILLNSRDAAEKLSMEINWLEVDKRLDKLRFDSLSFLKQAIY